MDFLHDLTGSLFGALALGIIIYGGGSMAIGYLARKSDLLKPIGVGLKLVVLFMSTQIFLHLGAAEHHPKIANYLNFFS